MNLPSKEKERAMHSFDETGLFGAIAAAVHDLQREAFRIAKAPGPLSKTLTCGELQKILDNCRRSRKLLQKVRFSDEESGA